MKNINIIVMGKTGAGKSTLVNAVLEEDLAPTGMGQAVTKQNKVYTKKMMIPVGECRNGQYGLLGCRLNIYDTVGLEIDSSITEGTLNNIKEHIENTKSKMSPDNLHMVWFCVNHCSSRFEDYELRLIRKLSMDYEIPFVIVLTQCFSDTTGELEIRIRRSIPEVLCKRVLAKDYKTRGGSVSAYGIPELLNVSVNNYAHLKVGILEKKLDILNEQCKERIVWIERKGNELIKKHVSAARKIGFVPVGCIPVVHGICIKLIIELNNLAGFVSSKGIADETFADAIFGIFASPFMAIPFLSASVASAYVETVGKDYLKAVLSVIDQSSDRELQDNTLIKERLKNELEKIKR